jgi:predicted HAD superfamily phosphohydrolase YqeG
VTQKVFFLFEILDPRAKTLIFDLDETLIHSCNLKENPQYHVKTNNELG